MLNQNQNVAVLSVLGYLLVCGFPNTRLIDLGHVVVFIRSPVSLPLCSVIMLPVDPLSELFYASSLTSVVITVSKLHVFRPTCVSAELLFFIMKLIPVFFLHSFQSDVPKFRVYSYV